MGVKGRPCVRPGRHADTGLGERMDAVEAVQRCVGCAGEAAVWARGDALETRVVNDARVGRLLPEAVRVGRGRNERDDDRCSGGVVHGGGRLITTHSPAWETW